MKLHRLVPVFLVVCIVFLALQVAHAQAPGTPQNLTVTINEPIRVWITWRHGSGSTPSHYIVNVNGRPTTVNHLPPSFSPTQQHTFLATPSTRYDITVTAVANGVSSSPARITVTTPTNVPSGVTANGGTGVADVEWNYIPGMESYAVYRTINNGSTWVRAWSGTGTLTQGPSGLRVRATVPSPSGRIGFAVTSTNRFTNPNESPRSTTVYTNVQ